MLAGGIIVEVKFGLPMWVWYVIFVLSLIVAWWTWPRSAGKSDDSRVSNDPVDSPDIDITSAEWSEESRLALELQKKKQLNWERRWRQITNSEFVLLLVFVLVLLVLGYTLPNVMHAAS